MDMKINRELLRRERERRAWTQSHLAEIANLSLRTVQRIERTGDASMESASALAAAFSFELTNLLAVRHLSNTASISNQSTDLKTKIYKLLGVFGLMAFAMCAMSWWSTASAEQVTISLSVDAQSGASTQGEMQFINELGTQTEIRFDQQFRLLVSVTRQNQGLLLSTEIYDYINEEYQLISSPSVLIGNNESTAIYVDSKSSGRLQLTFNSDF